MAPPLKIVENNIKSLPCNVEAEQAVIGSILVSNDIYDEISPLIDSQKFYDSLKQEDIDKKHTEEMHKIWNKIKNEDNFLEKYQYVEWDRIKWLNEYVPFLSILSLYNLISPLFNLLLPLIMLLIPFFLLKIMKIPITMTTYKDILFQQIKNH